MFYFQIFQGFILGVRLLVSPGIPNLVINEVAFNKYYVFPLYTSESSLSTGGIYKISFHLEHYICMVAMGEAIFQCRLKKNYFLKTYSKNVYTKSVTSWPRSKLHY